MGILERFGRIADTYVSEKEQLLEADEERRRVFTGHPFWPTEVLRDSIIFAAIIMVIAFYSWLIPPPLHNAADPYAQAGFVFPDWYVLFSYGYLRWGEYLPQFVIPAGPIGEFFGQPVISWNAGWWGAAITGLPVGILALPPFIIGKREKRGVEDPWFASAGAAYLAHVWFISVFSINIFLELYAKNRMDYCWIGHSTDFQCGTQSPWTAEIFNAVPWILTGIFIFAILYFATRKFLLGPMGARLTPMMGKQVAIGTLLATVLICSVTWPMYNNGFWNQRGLGTMGFWEYQAEDKLEQLDGLRAQPADTITKVATFDVESHWDYWEERCLPYSETSELEVWHTLHDGDDASDFCVIPAMYWVDWGIYQPTRLEIIDFSDANGHADSETSRNYGGGSLNYTGLAGEDSIAITEERTFEVEDLGVSPLPADISCNFRTVPRNSGTHQTSMVLTNSLGEVLWENSGESCEAATIYLDSGQSYTFSLTINSVGVNETVSMIGDFSAVAYQPLLISEDGTALIREGSTLSSDKLAGMTLANPTYHKNPMSLDAKLIYSKFIP